MYKKPYQFWKSFNLIGTAFIPAAHTSASGSGYARLRQTMYPTLSQRCEEELAILISALESAYHSTILKKAALYWKPNKSFAYYSVYFLTTTRSGYVASFILSLV